MTTTDTTPRPEYITVAADCLLCGAIKHFTGNRSNWLSWRAGEISSTEAFERMPASDRNWLLSGICPAH